MYLSIELTILIALTMHQLFMDELKLKDLSIIALQMGTIFLFL